MYKPLLLMSAAPLLALATLFATPNQAKAQYYYSPWYSYYSGGYYNPGWWPQSYYAPNYYWSGPRYDQPYTPPQSPTYRSFYAEPQDAANSAQLTIQLPADAELWFGTVLTRQQGSERQFVSPPLQSGTAYVYDLRARWMENGQVVERRQQVQVRSGERVRVNFAGEKVPAPEPAGKVKPAAPAENR